MQTWVDLKFADGEYRFFLGPAQIHELEKKCDAGIGRIYGRTLAGRYGLNEGDILPEQADYRFAELIEVLRQALIGGGHCVVDGVAASVSSIRANELIQRYVLSQDDRIAMRTLWALAAGILSALIEGYDPDPKAEPADEPATSTNGSTTRARSRTQQ
ncbi:MAG: gene transfer agent family protein [Candidatus Sphingomonas colombiensis]|nr:gene transfer agent family protein [Sphingomonas sp.]WEK42983.1 MAG: gene transfer agent family protein [Sphingomonas sp.]